MMAGQCVQRKLHSYSSLTWCSDKFKWFILCAAATLGEVEVVRIVSCDQRPLPRSFVAAVESKRPFHEQIK